MTPLCRADEHVDGLAARTDVNAQYKDSRLRYVYGMLIDSLLCLSARHGNAAALVCAVMLRRNPERLLQDTPCALSAASSKRMRSPMQAPAAVTPTGAPFPFVTHTCVVVTGRVVEHSSPRPGPHPLVRS